MALPHDYWLKYMLTYVEASVKDVQAASELYGLGIPGASYLRDLRNALKQGRPKPFRKNSSQVKRWIRRQRIMSLVREDKHIKSVRFILSDHRVRKTTQLLLISGACPEDIAEYVKEITGKKLHAKAINLFRHYFWNVEKLSLEQWSVFLKDWPDRDLYLNCRERGEDYTLWKLGYRIDTTDNELLACMLHEAQNRFFETSGRGNTKDTAATAKLWADIAFRALDEKNKSGDAVKQVLDELKSIAIHLNDTKTPSIDEVSNGRHSNRGFRQKS